MMSSMMIPFNLEANLNITKARDVPVNPNLAQFQPRDFRTLKVQVLTWQKLGEFSLWALLIKERFAYTRTIQNQENQKRDH